LLGGDEGFGEGMSVGRLVGLSVLGRGVGCLVGFTDGCCDGLRDGFDVGGCDDSRDGLCVGDWLGGDCEGMGVGTDVGGADGGLDGIGVGINDGCRRGASVVGEGEGFEVGEFVAF
jgi:hypothetical protein